MSGVISLSVPAERVVQLDSHHFTAVVAYKQARNFAHYDTTDLRGNEKLREAVERSLEIVRADVEVVNGVLGVRVRVAGASVGAEKRGITVKLLLFVLHTYGSTERVACSLKKKNTPGGGGFLHVTITKTPFS